jgi:hypothetical protein
MAKRLVNAAGEKDGNPKSSWLSLPPLASAAPHRASSLFQQRQYI